MRRPTCTILGGPNGSGKSSLHAQLGLPGEFVNADVVARGLRPEAPELAALAAGRVVVGRLRELVAARADLIYETTLSSAQALAVMRDARASGYEVAMLFVTLSNVGLNVMRVAERVAKGGHHVPEDVVRRRHAGSMSRLRQAIPLAHSVVIVDNSHDVPVRVATIVNGVMTACVLDPRRPAHARIAGAVADALGTDPDETSRVSDHQDTCPR